MQGFLSDLFGGGGSKADAEQQHGATDEQDVTGPEGEAHGQGDDHGAGDHSTDLEGPHAPLPDDGAHDLA